MTHRRIAMKISLWKGLALLGLGVALSAADGADGAEPKVGDKAPDFSLKGTDGKTHSLADYKGKKAVVLAWFPKASTPGCTAQCTSYAKSGSPLKGLDVAYFTASVDQPEANQKFARQVGADYPILSDTDKEVAKAYGVLNERGMANRWTFYIDKDGVIREIDKKIQTKQAAEDTIEKLRSLGIAAK